MKTISKRFLISFLLMFTLIISLFAMSPLIANAANIDAGSVSVNYKSFSTTRLYYKNGADDVTNDSEGYNAYFNPETNTLTLNNYEGDAIAIGGAIQEDVTIVLIGTNIITTSDQKAISSTNGGGIFITAESEASLTINCTAGQSAIYGIYTGSWGNGVLDISGNADVTINVNSTRNDSSVYGAYIDGTIDIKDNAKLTVNTSSLNPYSGYSVGMGLYAKQGITFNTTKKILVNTSGIPSENGNYGIYSDDKVDLKKAEELKIVVSAGSYAIPVYPAANTQNWTGFQASTNVEANVLTTTYTPIVTHTVTFNSNGGNGEMASVPVVENGTYELPACGFTAPTGYEFKCWSVNEVEKAVEDEITITADTTVKAVWKVKSYTITFNTNGGTTIAAITQDYNTAVQAPANPTKEGHTFKQWDKAIPATMPAENLTITAEWDINQYTITFNTDGGNAIAPITQDYGTAVVAPANPTKSGYTFTGWDKTIPSTMPAENMTITAQWTEFVPNTYTVTYTDGVDGVELFADQVNSNVTEGATTPTFNGTPVREGYTFAGWTPSVANTVTADATYTATWTINQYTITFNTDGGSTIAPITQDYGTAVVAPANPTKSGYTFTGWDKTIPSTMPAENMTITATWEINKYTITFNTNGGTTIAAITQDYNTAVQAPANPTKEGHTFKQWDKAIPATMPAENITITAEWDINQYTITFDTDGGNAIDPITQNYGTAVVAPANPTKSGYTFTGWDKTIPSTMPAENVTITAQWTEIVPNTYTVTYTDGVDNAEIFADQIYANVTEGTATPAFVGTPSRVGYTFKGWTPTVANTVTATVTYTATWEINQYTITFNTDGGSTVAPITQNYGTTVTAPTAPTKTGYTFTGWSAEVPTTMPAENVTLTAQWTVNQYTITFDTAGGNAIDPITQNYGTAVVAPANPTKDGYTFAGWDKTIPSTMPAENITITATWSQNHQHTDADGEWESDGTYHWHTCSCSHEFDKAECSGGTATCTAKAVCTVCNNEYGNTAAHSHGSEWKTDANEHWNECACGDKANKAAHTDSNNDGKCDTCEYQMSTTPDNPDNPNNTPDNPNNTPDDPSDDKDGLGAGAIVGIVIGSVALAGVGGFALFWFVIKKKSFADLVAVFKKK